MSDLDLAVVRERYAAWHGADNDAHDSARALPEADADPGETMSHYIVREDVPALIAEVGRLRKVEESVKALIAAAGDGFVTFGGGRSGGSVGVPDLRRVIN